MTVWTSLPPSVVQPVVDVVHPGVALAHPIFVLPGLKRSFTLQQDDLIFACLPEGGERCIQDIAHEIGHLLWFQLTTEEERDGTSGLWREVLACFAEVSVLHSGLTGFLWDDRSREAYPRESALAQGYYEQGLDFAELINMAVIPPPMARR